MSYTVIVNDEQYVWWLFTMHSIYMVYNTLCITYTIYTTCCCSIDFRKFFMYVECLSSCKQSFNHFDSISCMRFYFFFLFFWFIYYSVEKVNSIYLPSYMQSIIFFNVINRLHSTSTHTILYWISGHAEVESWGY